ncbi:MAG: hypothetical protein OXC06_01810 [Acidimicrobiaceae bacterium]|nr:hypothetical protein [Acidimicrobiaceae bacterium]
MSAEIIADPRSRRSSSDDAAAGDPGSTLGDYLGGVALIFDFVGSLARRPISTVRHPTDADALAADWDAVGRDLHWAMRCHPSTRPE